MSHDITAPSRCLLTEKLGVGFKPSGCGYVMCDTNKNSPYIMTQCAKLKPGLKLLLLLLLLFFFGDVTVVCN